MKLINKIVDKDRLVGYYVDDSATGGDKYGIPVRGLRSKILFDSLIASGYKYLGELLFEDAKGIMIHDLPPMNFSMLSEVEQEEFELLGSNFYSEEELSSHISTRQEVEALPSRAPLYELIKTREELESFLRTPIQFNTSDPKTYMPLNSFVSPVALYSFQEFMSSEVDWAFDMIANRRRLTFDQLRACKREMSTHGYVEGSSPLHFMEEYLSWGLCGIAAKCTYKARISSQYTLARGSSSSNRLIERDNLSVLMKRDGTFVKNPPMGFTSIKSKEALRSVRNSLQGDELAIVPFEREHQTELFTMTMADNFTVTTDCNYIRVKRDLMDLRLDGIRVISHLGRILPLEFWELGTKERQDEFLLHNHLETLTDDFFKRVTLETDGSTYKALRRCGVDEIRDIGYVLLKYAEIAASQKGTKGEESDVSEQDISQMRMVADIIEKYYADPTLIDESLHDMIEEWAAKVRDGEILIGNMADGRYFDSYVDKLEMFQQLKVVHTDLDVPIRVLVEKINSINLDKPEPLVFSSDKGTFTLPVVCRTCEYDGYYMDIESFRGRNALMAPNYLYVTTIYSEPGDSIETARHVGFRAVWLQKSGRKFAELEKRVKERIRTYFELQSEQMTINELDSARIDLFTARALTIAAYKSKPKGRTNTELALINSMTINLIPNTNEMYMLDESDVFTLRSLLKVAVVSTAQYVKYLMFNDNFRTFTVNAIVTPYWVVPTANMEIQVVPFYPNKAKLTPQAYETLKGRNLCSNFDYEPLDDVHFNISSIGLGLLPTREGGPENPESFRTYSEKYDNIDTSEGFIPPDHPYDAWLPNLPKDIRNAVDYKKKWDDKFHSVPIYKATSELIQKISPEMRWLFDKEEMTVSKDSRTTLFKGLNSEELLYVNTITDYLNIMSPKNEGLKATSFKDSMITFEDGSSVEISSLFSADLSKISVRKVSGNSFLFDTVGGARVMVRI